jgi:putative two-component system response regulator
VILTLSDPMSTRDQGRRASEPLRVLVLTARDESQSLAGSLEGQGFTVVACVDSEGVVERALDTTVDCVVWQPGPSGASPLEFARRVSEIPRARRLGLLILTPSFSAELEALDGFDAGLVEVLLSSSPPRYVAARIRALARQRRHAEERESTSSVLCALSRALEAKDSYTEGHGERVAGLASAFGEHLGLDPRRLDILRKGGLLHDLGKIGCPDSILNKPGPLTAEEYEVIRQHPTIGWEICKPLKSLELALPCIRSHHERLDGSGYPDGLRAPELALEVRIMSVVDIYDALSTARSYKPAFEVEVCFRILREEAERGWWDLELVESFVSMIQERGFDKSGATIPRLRPSEVFV